MYKFLDNNKRIDNSASGYTVKGSIAALPQFHQCPIMIGFRRTFLSINFVELL